MDATSDPTRIIIVGGGGLGLYATREVLRRLAADGTLGSLILAEDIGVRHNLNLDFHHMDAVCPIAKAWRDKDWDARLQEDRMDYLAYWEAKWWTSWWRRCGRAYTTLSAVLLPTPITPGQTARVKIVYGAAGAG